MVVKETRGRRRYILFTIPTETTKESLIRKLREHCPDPPYIIQCAPGKAIIRCSPDQRDQVIGLMSKAEPSSISLMTSGTLRTIREKHPDMKVPKKTS